MNGINTSERFKKVCDENAMLRKEVVKHLSYAVSKEELILAMAKAIQKIQHQGWHTWELCHEVARVRALRQAEECFRIVSDNRHTFGE